MHDYIINPNRIVDLPDDVFNRDCYVSYSGGADSTILLDEVANRASYTEKGKVYALSYEYCMFSQRQYSLEQRARRNFIEFLKKRYPNRVFNLEFNIGIDLIAEHKKSGLDLLKNPNIGDPQSLFWLLSSMVGIADDTSLFLGCIANDIRYFSHKSELEQLITVYKSLSAKPNLHIYTPYVTVPKDDILGMLFEAGIYEYIWYCEGVNASSAFRKLSQFETAKPCRVCRSCSTHFNALISLALRGVNKAKEALKNEFDFDFSKAQGDNFTKVDTTHLLANAVAELQDPDIVEPDIRQIYKLQLLQFREKLNVPVDETEQ